MPERLVDTRVQKSANTVSFISFFGKVPDVYIQKKIAKLYFIVFFLNKTESKYCKDAS